MSKLKTFIEEMPKCELPVDIEGTLEPEMKFQIAKRNQIKLPYEGTLWINLNLHRDGMSEVFVSGQCP